MDKSLTWDDLIIGHDAQAAAIMQAIKDILKKETAWAEEYIATNDEDVDLVNHLSAVIKNYVLSKRQEWVAEFAEKVKRLNHSWVTPNEYQVKDEAVEKLCDEILATLTQEKE